MTWMTSPQTSILRKEAEKGDKAGPTLSTATESTRESSERERGSLPIKSKF